MGKNMRGNNSCQTQRKLCFKGNVYFELDRPRRVRAALDFLQRVNPFYRGVLIRNSNIKLREKCPYS